MNLFMANVPTCICFFGASIVAACGHDGWGWLIFAGLLCAHWNSSDEDENDPPTS